MSAIIGTQQQDISAETEAQRVPRAKLPALTEPTKEEIERAARIRTRLNDSGLYHIRASKVKIGAP